MMVITTDNGKSVSKKINVGWKFDKHNANHGGHLCDAKELLRYGRVDPSDVLVRIVA